MDLYLSLVLILAASASFFAGGWCLACERWVEAARAGKYATFGGKAYRVREEKETELVACLRRENALLNLRAKELELVAGVPPRK